MDTSFISENILKMFNAITLIDIQSDKVFLMSSSNNVDNTMSYEEYIDNLKKIIHPDYMAEYFNKISLNELKNQEVTVIKYVKLSSNLAFDNYIDIIKVSSDDRIIILTLKIKLDDGEKVLSDNCAKVAADFIVELENIINNIKNNDSEVISTIKYISTLINDLLRKNNNILKEYENSVSIEVNKTFSSLLIVDDDTMTRNIFKKVFESQYNIIEAKNGSEAVELIEANIIKSDASHPKNIVGIFLDLKMPVMDGFGVLDYLEDKRLLNKLPVVIISADDAKETKEQVYKYAIADMIEKPFNFEIIKKRVSNMISMYMKSNSLNEMVRKQDRTLKKIVNSYANSYLIDYSNINEQVAKYTEILINKYNSDYAERLDAKQIASVSKYYDISLGTVPRTYIDNIKSLSDKQKELVLNYPNVGIDIIKYISDDMSESQISYAFDIIKMHNERFDGLGFPNKLQKDEIPMYVYLINIAIEYAGYMINHENNEEIVNIISSKSASKYDPRAVSIFVSVKDQLK